MKFQYVEIVKILNLQNIARNLIPLSKYSLSKSRIGMYILQNNHVKNKQFKISMILKKGSNFQEEGHCGTKLYTSGQYKWLLPHDEIVSCIFLFYFLIRNILKKELVF